MNYQAIYNRLISRGQSVRDLEFKERHHILPRCMGGLDSKDNLVDLTPEEHFVAHQLLLKIHPGHHGLAHAAKMMTVGRPRNKYYGWLKRRFISECRTRVGSKNPSFGTMWICNVELRQNRKISELGLIPEGWILGRNKWKQNCKSCKVFLGVYDRDLCDTCLHELRSEMGRLTSSKKRLRSSMAEQRLYTP